MEFQDAWTTWFQINDKFYESLIEKKKPEECIPSALADSVLDFLLTNSAKAKELTRVYAILIYCHSKGLFPTQMTTSLLKRDKVVRTYETFLLFEKLRRLGLVIYEPPTEKNMYTIPLDEVRYTRTELAKSIFKNES